MREKSKKIKHLTVLIYHKNESNELTHHSGIKPPEYIIIRKTLCGLEINPFNSEIESLVGFPTSEDIICEECWKIHEKNMAELYRSEMNCEKGGNLP